MQLTEIQQRVDLEGFTLKIEDHHESPVADPTNRHFLVDHYQTVTITCTGTNPRFGDEGSVTYLVTKLSGECVVDICAESDTPVVVLLATQRLQAVRVCEMHDRTSTAAGLILSIKDDQDGSTHNYCWVLRHAKPTQLH